MRVQPATTGPATPAIATNGIVATKDEMRLSFKVGGVIRADSRAAKATQVKQGQRLAEIELTEVNAQVEQARQLADKAQRDLERGERLYSDQVISLEQLQDLRTQAAMSAGAAAKHASSTAATPSSPRRAMASCCASWRKSASWSPAGQPVLIVGARERRLRRARGARRIAKSCS